MVMGRSGRLMLKDAALAENATATCGEIDEPRLGGDEGRP
jgi:hypothetical protein